MDKNTKMFNELIENGTVSVSDFYSMTIDRETIKFQGDYESLKVVRLQDNFNAKFTISESGYTILETKVAEIKVRIVLT